MARQVSTQKVPVEVQVAGPVGRIPLLEARKLKYRPAARGLALQPAWSTWWFRVKGKIPTAWKTRSVDLIFNTRSEAQVWIGGEPYQGLNYDTAHPYQDGGRVNARLPVDMVKRGVVDLEVEAAANGLFGIPLNEAGYGNVSEGSLWVFTEAALALVDAEASKLYHDLFVPAEWVRLAPDIKKLDPWRGFVLSRLNEICNRVTPEDRLTWKHAAPILKEIYRQRNASFSHEITAIGHAHIDTGWLWPVSETIRKCARTFSTATRYMERYPDYRFACSQAVQYEMMKERYPGLYQRIQAAVKRGQWVPVGGTWVEPDCNIPSGESLVRQFLYGKRFFRKELGFECREFWNPDVFGYTGALPQIMKEAGMDHFVTQKLSWNQFNKPIHQSFYWEGIDGSRILTHFPPADTYNAMAHHNAVRDLVHHAENATDNDRTNQGLMLFGYGDGGGGPTTHMLEVLSRVKDFQGLPRTAQRPVDAFFTRLKKSLRDIPVMSGELYFELHRGTYTSQARTKLGNRRSEIALRAVELLFALSPKTSYPAGEIEALWKTVLLNQFHDILPGSSIGEVYRDSDSDYAAVLKKTSELQKMAALSWGGGKGHSFINPCSWTRSGVVEGSKAPKDVDSTAQKSVGGAPLSWISAPSMGAADATASKPPRASSTVVRKGGNFLLENGKIRAEFLPSGELIHLVEMESGRESILLGEKANSFVLYDDHPNHWDAWDMDVFHLETRKAIPGAKSVKLLERGPLRSSLEFAYDFAPSRMTVRVSLDAGSGHLEFAASMDWRHRHRFLKVEFPVDVKSDLATFEIQYGAVTRPTHFNTTHDIARFESSAQRFIDLGEPGFGVSLFTDCKYGYAVHGRVMRLSLLRSPTSPDPEADQGAQAFRYAVYPHQGSWRDAQTVRRAYEFNHPWIPVPLALPTASRLSVDSPHLIVDAVKKAEDSASTIVRLYECHGERGEACVTLPEGSRRAEHVNLLEETKKALPVENGRVRFSFRPFELITLKVS
jgi:alpha-mannosidase